MDRTWMTRVAAIVGVTAITMYAMKLQIDGVMVPVIGAAGVAGIAGYDLGVERAAQLVGE